MKTKTKCVYVITDSCSGRVFYADKKPNKSFLMEICQKEFFWDEEEFLQRFKDQEIVVVKEKVYSI